MSRNGSGIYTLVAGNPVTSGTTITSSWANSTLSDIASTLTLSVASDGQTPMSGNLNMASNKIVALATPTLDTDATTKAYVDALIAGGSAGVFTSVTDSSLTNGRLTYATTGGLLTDSANLTFNGTTLTSTGFSGPLTSNSITDSALTSGRVTFASTGGLLSDSASLTFDGTTITSTKFAGAFNGTLGATTPNTGAFTTLSASSTVSGTGFSTYLASPPAIGSTSASTGAFTTLSASSTVSGTGFTNYFASPPALGSTAPSTVKATSVTNTGLTSGRIPYSTTGGLQTDSANLQFDGNNLGIGTTPSYKLDIVDSTSNQIKLGNSGSSNYLIGRNTSSGLLSFYGNQTGFTGYSFGGIDGERMRLDSSGNLGIGVTPSAWASTVKSVQAGSYGSLWSGTISSQKYTALYANAYFNGSFNLYQTSDYATSYYSTNGTHNFGVAASGTAGASVPFVVAMQINNAGGVQAVNTISVGNATPSTSGAGISFPATQSASSDANTLDDYEEGTFTPSLNRSGSAPTVTYSAQNGYYTKIGNQVTCVIALAWTANSGGSGNFYVASLPFTNKSATNNYADAAIGGYDGITLAAGCTQLGLELIPNQTFGALSCMGSAATSNVINTVAAAGDVYLTLTYFTT